MERRPVDYLQPYRGFTYTELNAENRGILNNEQQCSICMADFVNGCLVVTTECQHSYHYACLLIHLTRGIDCPLCRRGIVEEPISAGNWRRHLNSLTREFGPRAGVLLAIPQPGGERGRGGIEDGPGTEPRTPRNQAQPQQQGPRPGYMDEETPVRAQRDEVQPAPQMAAREAPQVVRVNVGQFVGVGGKTTKKELLKVLQLQYGFYPPPERMASTSFLRDLLSGEKKMVRLEELRAVDHVEAYEELSLSRLLDYAGTNLPRLFEYLPQPFIIGKLSRGYVVNIMNSLEPGLVERLRVEAIQRAKARNREREEDDIVLSEQFQGILTNPLFPLGGNRRLLSMLANRPARNNNN